MSKVLTVGTFDLPHSGHLNLFRICRKLADLQASPSEFQELGARYGGEVLVGVNSDLFIYRYKKNFPVYDEKERLRLISQLKDVDRVILNDDNSMQALLARERPDFLVVGSDWAAKDYYKQIGVSQDWLDSHKIILCYVPYTQGVSTTILKERINAR